MQIPHNSAQHSGSLSGLVTYCSRVNAKPDRPFSHLNSITLFCSEDTARHPAGTAESSAAFIDETLIELGQVEALAHPVRTIGMRITNSLSCVRFFECMHTNINKRLSLFTRNYMNAAQ